MNSPEETTPKHEQTDITAPQNVAAQSAQAAAAASRQSADSPEHTAEYEKLNRRALLLLLLLLSAATIPMLRLFVAPIVVSFTIAALFYPFYRWVRRRVGPKRSGIASFLACLILLLGLFVPMYVVGHLVTVQTVDLYNTAGPKIKEVVAKGNEGPLGALRENSIIRWLRLNEVDIQALMQEGTRATGKIASFVVNKTSIGILAITANLFVVFFMLFYLFRDGHTFLKKLQYLSPLRDHYENMLFDRFLLISRASIRGTVLIGVIQGTLGGLTLLVFGVHTWLLWGFVMVVLSIIPFTGAWFVMVPAGIIQIILGNTAQGISIIVICVVVVSTIDNVLRPRLVGTEAKMHDLLIFFSTLGGISVFGVLGFIVGPVIAALFVTILDIYALEFRSQLATQSALHR